MIDQEMETRPTTTGAGSPQLCGRPQDSQQVAWWPVHEFLTAMLDQANTGPLPWAGTPAWCELADSDPRKLLALAQFGEHHALRIETMQTAQAAASREISAAANWSALAQRIRNRASSPYITRRKSA